ncbi:hypothetical protein P0136_06580 [Lentisphaerota bacterium ZTH]|nr:hypothetical protein JYG24_02310 [Lentisphaerota bacterium]WET07655.1 hypothetical protein P0136_06580 [Lentisphaerota bacterium ZTH]
MKLGKRILFFFLGLLIVVIIALVVVFAYLDTIVAGGIRKFGSEALGTKVSVSNVYISVLNGNLKISGLKIANPDGYLKPDAFKMGSFAVDMDIKSIFSDTIVIKKITISDMNVDYEPTIKGGSNLKDLQNNVAQYSARSKKAEPAVKEPAKPTAPAPEGKKKKVIIEELVVNNGTVQVSSKMLNQSASVTLNKFEMQDIGKKNNDPVVVFNEVFTKLLDQIAKDLSQAKISGLDLSSIKEGLLKNIDDNGDNTARTIGKSIRDITDKVFGSE